MNEGQHIEQDINEFFAKSDKEQRDKLEQRRRADEARAEKQRREAEKRQRESEKRERERQKLEKKQEKLEHQEAKAEQKARKEQERESRIESVQEGIGEAVSGFASGAKGGQERTENIVMGGVGAGVKGISTAEKVAGSMIGGAGKALGGILIPTGKAEEITFGDRIAYPIKSVLRDDKYLPAWRVVKMPYKSTDDTELDVEFLSGGAKDVGSLGKAYKTIEDITGSPPVDLFVRLKEMDESEGMVEMPNGLPKIPTVRLPRIAQPRKVQMPVVAGISEVG
jgi:hypothetical protein